jgi:hypothetical protein
METIEVKILHLPLKDAGERREAGGIPRDYTDGDMLAAAAGGIAADWENWHMDR